jgi:cytochrome P450
MLGSRSVLLLDDAPHMRARKLLLPPFHGERMKAYAAVMTDLAEREAASWPAGAPVRMLPRMQALTLEIIMRTVFGSQDPRLRDALRHMLDGTSGPVGMAMMVVLGPRRLANNRLFRSVLDPVDALIREQIRRSDGEGDDVLSMLRAAGMDEDELRDELMTLLVAGHETTATGLAWAIERLVRHEAAWAGLRDGDEAWADAVVKETLRLRPVLPVVVRRLTRPATVGGMDLPAGIVVAPCIFLVHRRPDLYPDPHAFRPERFLGVKPGTSTWLPFGGGVRRCIGAAFAEMEMRLVLEAVARTVELRAARPGDEPVRRRAITLTPGRGGEVVVAGNLRAPASVSRVKELVL